MNINHRLAVVRGRRRTNDAPASEVRCSAYGDRAYWTERYGRSAEDKDRLCDWRAIRAIVVPRLAASGRRVLHVGCGSSRLGVDMAAEGFVVTNADANPQAVEAMRVRYPSSRWLVVDAANMPQFRARTFDAVIDTGTLDALTCNADESLAHKMVAECCRVGRVFVCVGFGPPKTRLKFFRRLCVRHHKVHVHNDLDTTYVYVARRSRRLEWSSLAATAVCSVACVVSEHYRREPPASLEPVAGAAQCNYELLKAFADRARGLNWTLGAGTLLGAMRTAPPGLLQWEHDVDVYATAPAALAVLRRLEERSDPVLDFRGFVDRDGRPCCGFGYKLFHREVSACELDVLVLAASSYAPWAHAKHWLWPPWGPPAAKIFDFFYNSSRDLYLVIPEDLGRKRLLEDAERAWDLERNRWRGGPSVAYFHREHFTLAEFFPIDTTFALYDLAVNVPQDPWASLHRTYGADAAYMARIDEHGGVKVDLRRPENARFLSPASVVTGS